MQIAEVKKVSSQVPLFVAKNGPRSSHSSNTYFLVCVWISCVVNQFRPNLLQSLGVFPNILNFFTNFTFIERQQIFYKSSLIGFINASINLLKFFLWPQAWRVEAKLLKVRCWAPGPSLDFKHPEPVFLQFLNVS